ncbi:MAG: glycosyl transferase, partial [Deferribacterales bacterium]|nr:glycosyl transferase [Deferribacterales bacterium]
MRILHIINVRWFNATAWYAYRLAEAGIALGDEAVIAGLPSSPVVNMAKDAGIGVFEADFNSNNILTIIKTIKRTAS